MPTYSTGSGNAYTGAGSSSLGGTPNGAGLIQQAYDRLIEFQLRATPMLRQIADKRPANQSIPGSTVSLQIHRDLDKQTAALDETPDLDAVAFGTPFIKNILLKEYGNAAISTRKLQAFSLAEVDPLLANSMAFNMADSLDEVVQTELLNGTQVARIGNRATKADVVQTDIITAAAVRRAVSKLRSNKVVPRKGTMYYAALHPEVSHDLREATGAATWRDPHVYNDPSNIYAGEIGSFEGAFFVESPRLSAVADATTKTVQTGQAPSAVTGTLSDGTYTVKYTVTANSTIAVGDWVLVTGITGTDAARHNGTFQVTALDGTTGISWVNNAANGYTTVTFGGTPLITEKVRVYSSFLCGQQALAEAVAEEPHTVIGPVVDKLNRFRPIGWYGILGFKVYREEALYRIESGSSISNF